MMRMALVLTCFLSFLSTTSAADHGFCAQKQQPPPSHCFFLLRHTRGAFRITQHTQMSLRRNRIPRDQVEQVREHLLENVEKELRPVTTLGALKTLLRATFGET